MGRRRATTPFDLGISSKADDEIDLEHTEITVECTHDVETATGQTLSHTLTGYRWCAGILGQLAVALAGPHARLRQDHGCRYEPDWGRDGCLITGLLDFHAQDMTSAPVLWIYVPHTQADSWVALVTSTLDQILTRDAARPTEQEEREWSEGPPS